MDPTQEIEVKILATIRSKDPYYKYRSILQPSFFGSEETRQLFHIITEFFTKNNNRKLTTGNMKLLINKHIKDKDLNLKCNKLTRSIRRITSRDNKVIEDTIKDFAKRQLVKIAITKSLEILDNPDPDFSEIRDHIDRACTLSTDDDTTMVPYFMNPEERHEEGIAEKKIPTGILSLDKELAGGMCPGELFVFLGPPGRGKTTALINVGLGALIQGLRVCHVTMEISARGIARRYDMRITGRTVNTLKKNPDRVKNPLASLRKRGCDLIIKDYSMEDPTVDDLYAMIVAYEARTNKKFDVVIIDYGDLVRPKIKAKDARFGLEEVYTDLRRMGNKLQVPVYTASQSNRESLNKNKVGMGDVAESFGKVKVADVVVGLCQTPEEEEDKMIRLYIAKSRKKSGHPTVRLEFDSDKMFMGEFRHETRSKSTSTRRLKKNY